jgi:hypothetical protein
VPKKETRKGRNDRPRADFSGVQTRNGYPVL